MEAKEAGGKDWGGIRERRKLQKRYLTELLVGTIKGVVYFQWGWSIYKRAGAEERASPPSRLR